MFTPDSSYRTVLALVLLAFIGTPAAAQSDDGVAVFRVVDDAGKPVAGRVVRVVHPFSATSGQRRARGSEARTDDDGIAAVVGLPGGEPVIGQVAGQNVIATQSAVVRTARLDAKGTRPPVQATLVLTAGRTLRVRVTGADGKPAEHGEVRLLPLTGDRGETAYNGDRPPRSGPTRRGETDAAGVVTFDQLPADLLICEARGKGLQTQVRVVEPAAETITIDFPLPRDENPPPPSIPWSETISQALERAKRDHLPVLVAMTMDGERANDSLPDHHYRDREIARVARAFPALLSSAFGKGGLSAERVDHDEDHGICRRYGTIPCASHQGVEQWARARFLDQNGSIDVPRHIMLDADGSVLIHRVFYLPERELLGLMVRGLRAVNPAVASELARARLAPLLADLSSPAQPNHDRAVTACVRLVNGGDEFAVALLADLAASKVPAPDRAAIARGLLPEAIEFLPRAVSALIADPDAGVRREIVQSLAAVAARTEVADLLVAAMHDADASVRQAVLGALGVESRDGRLTVRGEDEGLRLRVIEGLLADHGIDAVLGVREAAASPEHEGRNRVLRAIARRAATDVGAATLLLERASDSSVGAVCALRLLTKSPPPSADPAAIVALVKRQASSPNSLVAEEATRIMAQPSFAADPDLLRKNLTHPAHAVAIEAALGLWRQGDHSVGPFLRGCLADPEFGAEIGSALGH